MNFQNIRNILCKSIETELKLLKFFFQFTHQQLPIFNWMLKQVKFSLGNKL
jgi:hypothetical protein